MLWTGFALGIGTLIGLVALTIALLHLWECALEKRLWEAWDANERGKERFVFTRQGPK